MDMAVKLITWVFAATPAVLCFLKEGLLAPSKTMDGFDEVFENGAAAAAIAYVLP